MNLRRILLVVALLTVAVLGLCRALLAQVPPHPPGTVCYTPQFWCYVQPAPAGSACACPTPYGWVSGIRN